MPLGRNGYVQPVEIVAAGVGPARNGWVQPVEIVGGGGGGGAVGDIVDASGSTTDSYVEVTGFPVSRADGLIGIGSILNNGANGMNVRETVTDKFGNTQSTVTLVAAGDSYLLDLQTNFAGAAFPPFTGYTVEVESASAGNPTDYDLHFVDITPGSGGGGGSETLEQARQNGDTFLGDVFWDDDSMAVFGYDGAAIDVSYLHIFSDKVNGFQIINSGKIGGSIPASYPISIRMDATEVLGIDASGVTVTGKLTVTGAIDPTSLSLSGGTELFLDSADGSTAPLSAAGHARIRYVDPTGWEQSINGGAYAPLGGGGGMVIGDPVVGGTAWCVLTEDTNANLANSVFFNFDPAMTFNTSFSQGGGNFPVLNLVVDHDTIANWVGANDRGRGWGTFNIQTMVNFQQANTFFEHLSDDAVGPVMHMRKGRITGGFTTQEGDLLGGVQFDGWDAQVTPDNHVGVEIYATLDSTPVSNYIPSKFHILVSDSNSYQDWMTIDGSGRVDIEGDIHLGPMDESNGMIIRNADSGGGEWQMNFCDNVPNTIMYLDTRGVWLVGESGTSVNWTTTDKRLSIIPGSEADILKDGLTVYRQGVIDGSNFNSVVLNSFAGVANLISIYTGDGTTRGFVRLMTSAATTGSPTSELEAHTGIIIGAPTGSYKGTGTLNVQGALYRNNIEVGAIGSGVTGGTAGSILFLDGTPALAQDNANLFYDNASNTLCLGSTSGISNYQLYLKSAGSVARAQFETASTTGDASLYCIADTANMQTALAQFGSAVGGTLFGVNLAGMGIVLAGTASTSMVIGTQNGSAATYIVSGGAVAMTLNTDQGITVGSPTGGSKGGGTINVSGDIYKNNTAYTNPDYAIEHWATGKIERFAENKGAKEYSGRKSLVELEEYCRKNFRLPGISDDAMGLFDRSDFVLEKIEEIFTYLFDLRRELLPK